MSTESPDFTTAPAWLDTHGTVWAWLDIATYADKMGPEWASSCAPWTPLGAPEGHAQRIDRDKLAERLARTPDPSHPGMGTRHIGMDWARSMADAVIAALPELMAGEQA